MAGILERLTEGVVLKNMQQEVAPLVSKWGKLGLLEGLKSDMDKTNMARLLENQARELLRESAVSTIGGGDIQGFAAVAFPLVRRVFGSLLANDLVSVQPMSLPSGLIFFLDFTRNDNIGAEASGSVYSRGDSIFGDRLGAEITKGIRLDGQDAAGRQRAEIGLYSQAHGYHLARKYVAFATGSLAAKETLDFAPANYDAHAKKVRFDPDVVSLSGSASVIRLVVPLTSSIFAGDEQRINEQNVFACSLVNVSGSLSAGQGGQGNIPAANCGATDYQLVRRLSKIFRSGSSDQRYLELFAIPQTGAGVPALGTTLVLDYPVTDDLTAATATGLQEPGTALGILLNAPLLEGTTTFPELKLKVNSMMINTESRKLKASWTPELSQDLNAYHNLDAEVELTNLLSEQISQEIDQLLLNDLVKGATAGTYYWSRRPGKFVNRTTGADLVDSSNANNYLAPPDFTGNVSMWYETLIETVNDVSALIMRKTLRGGATFLVTSPEVANILEMTAGFRASVSHADEKGSVGVVNVGSISKKWDVMVSAYFPRNLILVGRKGTGFLESGYVYSPYVPLQMTPTIFDPDDFTPRKAVMTRFGRKMVRPDMYGAVVVRDLLG